MHHDAAVKMAVKGVIDNNICVCKTLFISLNIELKTKSPFLHCKIAY